MDSKINKFYKKIYNNNKDVIIFGLSYCVYCKKTIELLKKKNISFKYYLIDDYFKLFFDIFLTLHKLYPNFFINPEHKTVPVIFYKKKFVGGFDELSQMIK